MRGEDFAHWHEVACDAIAHGDQEFGYSIIEQIEDEAAAQGLDGLPDCMG